MSEENETITPEPVFGPDKWKRDGDYGLIGSVDYVFDEYGGIDWRATIPSKYKYPNKEWFFLNGKDKPETAEGLSDEQTIISLKGLKWAAKVRGYKSCIIETKTDGNTVTAECEIKWIPNYETDHEVIYMEVANASPENVDEFCSKFLETVAANRAFCRCVRNFLNVNSVSDEEIDTSEKEEESKATKPASTKPQDILAALAFDKGYEDFKFLQDSFKGLGFFHDKMDAWVEYKNIPAKSARELIAKLKDS